MFNKLFYYIFVSTKTVKEMKITTENKSYLFYTIFNDRINIDQIESFVKGDGSKLISELKDISREMCLPIELYSEPMNKNISKINLNAFY